MLAPSGFIDYSVKMDYSRPPRPIAVYLAGINEKKVAEEDAAAIVEAEAKDARGLGRFTPYIMISGDTETKTENPMLKQAQAYYDAGEFDKLEEFEKEFPIQVHYRSGKLTVRAKEQPLSSVIYAIAGKLSIPAEISGKVDIANTVNDQTVSIDVKDQTVEDVMGHLSPYIVLYMRTDLETSATTPLRIILTEPKANTVPAAKNAASTSADTTKTDGRN